MGLILSAFDCGVGKIPALALPRRHGYASDYASAGDQSASFSHPDLLESSFSGLGLLVPQSTCVRQQSIPAFPIAETRDDTLETGEGDHLDQREYGWSQKKRLPALMASRPQLLCHVDTKSNKSLEFWATLIRIVM